VHSFAISRNNNGAVHNAPAKYVISTVNQGRIDAPGSSQVEGTERKAAGSLVPQNVAGDQIPRNDEEDIDADETALETRDLQMEQQNAEDGDRSKLNDLPAKTRLLRTHPQLGHQKLQRFHIFR
jgi:hypothetical protein